MVDLAPDRKNIQIEESRFRTAVSESLIQKVGSSVNFINYYQHSEKQFFLNGNYNYISAPVLRFDGMTFFQYDAEVIDVWMFVQVQSAMTSGTTELDLKYATTPGGSFTSIFTTTPKIQYNAGNDIWIHVGSTVTNTTAPVLSVTNFDAEWALRLDVLQVPTGTPGDTSGVGTGLLVHYRPR
jgi:hypothetical protein